MVPIKLNITELAEEVNRYFESDYGLERVVRKYEGVIEEINEVSYRITLKNMEVVFKLLRIPEKQSVKTMREIVEVNTRSSLRKREVGVIGMEEYWERLVAYQVSLLEEVMKQFEEYLRYLRGNKLQTEEFIRQECLHHLWVSSVRQVAAGIAGFGREELFVVVKRGLFEWHASLERALVEQSRFTMAEMRRLEELLKKYPSLANVESYKVLQKESAFHIWHTMGHNLERYHFLRQEYHHYQDVLRQQIIGNLYDYSDHRDPDCELPYHPATLQSAVPKHKQGVDILVVSHPQRLSDVRWTTKHEGLLQEGNHLTMTQLLQGRVEKYQKYSHRRGQREMVVVQIHASSSTCTYGLERLNSLLCVVCANQLDLAQWQPASDIECIAPHALLDFLSLTLDFHRAPSQLAQHPGSQHLPADAQHLQLLRKEDLASFQRKQQYSIMPQDQLTIGNHTQLAMTSGCIGAGIGCLILDSMDDSIPWDDKLKRAGQTTLTSGVLTGVFLTMPVLSAILIQVYVVYMVKHTFSNEVLNNTQKIKQLGHLGV